VKEKREYKHSVSNYRTWIELNQRALQQNICSLQSILNPGTRFCAVVKANAYGHGMKEIALIAARTGVDAFAVDSIDEALTLRDLLPSALLIVLGYTLQDRLIDAVQQGIELTVYDPDTIRRLEEVAASLAKITRVHLKVETGTSRQGVLAQDLKSILEILHTCPHIEMSGLSTPFANVEDADDSSYANRQFAHFLESQTCVTEAGFTPAHIHCACSAAFILYPDTHATLVRAGISMYGVWPSKQTEQFARRHAIKLELEPVLAWKTQIAQVKSLPAGTPVSYGLTEVLRRQSRVAVLPVGYSDGYDRRLSSIGEVLIGGHRCKVLGRICMNMMMVDVSEVPQIAPEQEAILLGRMGCYEVSAVDMAEKIHTIPYEVVARLNPLLPRIVV
jgi:alanine racemase